VDSPVKKRSITIRGHRTSFSVEDTFYEELLAQAEKSGQSLARLVTRIDMARAPDVNLSSAIRLHVFENLKTMKRGGSG
jgi:predicted DNA-binding ribbon-helix-helix protein